MLRCRVLDSSKSLFTLLACLLLGACGIKAPGDEDDSAPITPSPKADCSSYTACGGNLVGRWRMLASCFGTAGNDPACDGYVSNQTTSGTAIYEFGSDGVLRYEGAIHVAYDVSVTEACAQAVAHRDLPGYCKLLEDSADDNPRVPADITCNVSDSLCECHVDQGPISGGSGSSYALSGNSVTMLEDGGANTYGYCVRDDMLTLGSLTGAPNSVFVRQ